MSILKNIEAFGGKVKAGLIKAMQEVDGVILPEAEVLEPILEKLLDAVLPGSGRVAQVAENCLIALAKVIDAGGAAAEQNLLSAGLDAELIADAKMLIPTLKAAVKTA